MFDQDENLRNAMLKRKAKLADIESNLSRPPVTNRRWGIESKPSQGAGVRLQENRLHLQEVIADLERELLLRQHRKSTHPATRDVRAQLAIEKKLAERGIYLRSMGESTTADMPPETEPSNEARLKLGKWAEERLAELRKFTRLLRGGTSPESLHTQFPALFTDVIERLQKPKRESWFEQAQGRLMNVPEMLDWIGDVKGLSGTTLGDYRKEYRKQVGTGRKRRPVSTPTKP